MSNLVPTGRPAEILLVEDSQSDVILTREGLKEGKLANRLHHVENGEQAMAFLRKQGEFADAPTPDIILLDLNMPVMDGREVLAEIVADNELNQLPVVILTTSDSDRDVLEMYKLRANSYIKKPVEFGQFVEAVKGISDYWFNLVVLPPH